MIKIGFIDYCLDEWHANNYPAWIRRGGQGYDVSFAWAADDKRGGMTTAEWCAKHNVARAETQEELIDKCDAIVVLSPDNPEQHPALSRLALMSGKPTYVDKTFSVSVEAAKEMIRLAKAYNTPMYSTSALRYASELNRVKKIVSGGVRMVSARGPGLPENYAIHQIEMIVALMGAGVKRAMASGADASPLVVFEYADGRAGVINHQRWSGFALSAADDMNNGVYVDIRRDFWPGFVKALLAFFKSSRPPVGSGELLEAMTMVELTRLAIERKGEWVEVGGAGESEIP